MLSRAGKTNFTVCAVGHDSSSSVELPCALGRIAQFQPLENGMQDVAARPCRPAHPYRNPTSRGNSTVQDRVGRTHRRRPDEGVPVERLGHALVVFGTHQPLRPDRAVGEGLDLAHLADFAVPYPFAADLAHAFGRSALVAHLRGYLVLGGQFGQQTRFVDRVRQRFLAIDVLAGRNGVGRDDRVGVVGRSHHDRIGRFEHLVVHAAVIVVAFGRGVTLEDMLRVFPVGYSRTAMPNPAPRLI